MMNRRWLLAGFSLLLATTLVLVACEEAPDDPVAPGNGNDEPGFDYELIASEKTLPLDSYDNVIELAENQSEFERLWQELRVSEPPPGVDWERQVVFFFGTGESGTCPLHLMDVRYDPDERLVTAEVDEDLPPDAVCTDDWTPRSFVVAVSAGPLDGDDLSAQLYHPDRGPFATGEEDRVTVRG
jgi:hypothetical protein